MKLSKQVLGLSGLMVAVLLMASPAWAVPTPSLQIVESVPAGTIYGQPSVPRTQQVWLEMIRAARTRIDIAAFYIANKPGKALQPVLDALVTRARAGVKVRILLDQTFMHESRSSYEWLRKVPNIAIRILPVNTLTGGVLHAKYFIVDGKTVFVGSQNWDWRALSQIHEIGVRIHNRRLARTFEAVFKFDWRLASDPSLPKAAKLAMRAPTFAPVTAGDPVILRGAHDAPLMVFPAFSPPSMSPHWVSAEQPELVRLIESAQHTLRVQVMSLSALVHYGPKGYWPALDTALRDAAARGVKVQIIVADWALRRSMQAYLKSLAALPGITVKFSTLPRASGGFIPYARVEHCKYAVADGRRVYIGTGNWQWSYFHNSVDASVFISGSGPARTLTRIFKRDWDGPYVTTLQPAGHYKPPRIR